MRRVPGLHDRENRYRRNPIWPSTHTSSTPSPTDDDDSNSLLSSNLINTVVEVGASLLDSFTSSDTFSGGDGGISGGGGASF